MSKDITWNLLIIKPPHHSLTPTLSDGFLAIFYIVVFVNCVMSRWTCFSSLKYLPHMPLLYPHYLLSAISHSNQPLCLWEPCILLVMIDLAIIYLPHHPIFYSCLILFICYSGFLVEISLFNSSIYNLYVQTVRMSA